MAENKEPIPEKGHFAEAAEEAKKKTSAPKTTAPAKKRTTTRKKAAPKTKTTAKTDSSFKEDAEEIKKMLREIDDTVKTSAAGNSGTENLKFMKILEGLSVMREDFIRLSRDMKKHAGSLSSEEIIDSFGAYSVDIENLLTDAGVVIKNTDENILNTKCQKIVSVIPSKDSAKDGTVAERYSECYMYGDRVLWKERVAVYKKSQSQNGR